MSRPSFRPASLAVAAVLAISASAAQAQSNAAALSSTPVEIHISPSPLAQALDALARQTRLELMVQPDLVAGKSAPAVSGRLSPREALNRLLMGSGLQADIEGSVVTLRRAPAPTGVTPAASITLSPVTVTASADRATTEQTGSYTTRALTLGKMDQSIRETPQSLTVVTRQQMDDQNLVSIEDVISQTTGASKSQRNFGAHVYTMRGYVIPSANYLIDGVSGGAYDPTGWVPIDTATFDRVEVLRGAGALAVGAGDPSGVVNMVRKRPRSERHIDFAQSIGSWNHYRTEVDAGGPVNEAGTVRGRVVAAYTDREYFYELAHSKEPLVYGVIDADLGPNTKVTAGLRHQEQDVRGYTIFQLPMYSNATSLNLPRSTSLGQHWNRHQASVDDVFTELEHRFSNDWRAKVTLNHSKTSIVQKLNTARGAVNPTTGLGFNITSNYFVDRDIDGTGLDANLSGRFQAFGRMHKALVGTSWSEQEHIGRSTTVPLNIPANVFDFDHGQIPEPVTPAYANQAKDTVSLFSLYANSQLEVLPSLNLHLGGRLNWYKYRTDNLLTGRVTNDYKQDAQLTPYMGLVYDLGPQWSVYGSYASTFQPQSQYAVFNGGALKPAEGDNYEVGIKGELMDRRLNVAMAFFHTKKRNVAVQDLDHIGDCPGITTNNCYRNASLLVSHGVDLEIAGRVFPGWEVAAGYTYLNTRDPSGQPLTSDAPRNMLRASTTYTLPGAWSAWTVGANLRAQSSSFVTVVKNPGRSILDLRVGYRISPTWSAALMVGNVFDKTYWQVVGGTVNGNAYGTPRNAMLTLRASF